MLALKQGGLKWYYSSDLGDTLLWLKELTTSSEENIKTKKPYKNFYPYVYMSEHKDSVIILFLYRVKILMLKQIVNYGQ